MSKEIILFFYLWAMIGAVAITLFDEPKHIPAAVQLVFIGGPIVWLIFIYLCFFGAQNDKHRR